MSRGWLIDTNIISEWVKPRPDTAVVRWLEEVGEDRVFLSVVSLAEIRFGVERLAPGAAMLDWTSGSERSCRRASRAAYYRWTGQSRMPVAACWRERGGLAAGSARWTL